MKSSSVILLLLITLFLLISNQTDALKTAKEYSTDTATVKSHQLILSPGTKGASSISSTHDYATVATTAGFTFYENASYSGAQTYHPTSMNLLVGTNLSGGVSNLTLVDGICVNFNETTGATGFDFYFNFTGVASASSFIFNMYEYYSGNFGHTINIDLYNFTSSSWKVIGQYNDEPVFTWHNITVSSTNGLIQSGTVMGRLVHVSGGSIFHYERIDYIALSTSGSQTNTDFTIPTSSDSFTIAAGSSALLYSPTFTTATTMYAGFWILDLWASATSSGSLTVNFIAVNSSNISVGTAVTGSTGTIGTSKSEVKTSFLGSQITVPSGGRLVAVITNPSVSGRTVTVYWGSGQATNYQTPSEYDYVIAVPNSAVVPFCMCLSAYSSSGISRLTNLTVSIYTPFTVSTKQVIIINGSFTQYSGTAITIPATSTLYILVHSEANSFGSSNVVLLMEYSPSSRPFAYDFINLTVN